MGFARVVAVTLHAAAVAVMSYAWMQLDSLPNNAWVSKQKGGHLQFLSIQGYAAASATYSLFLILIIVSREQVDRRMAHDGPEPPRRLHFPPPYVPARVRVP